MCFINYRDQASIGQLQGYILVHEYSIQYWKVKGVSIGRSKKSTRFYIIKAKNCLLNVSVAVKD